MITISEYRAVSRRTNLREGLAVATFLVVLLLELGALGPFLPWIPSHERRPKQPADTLVVISFSIVFGATALSGLGLVIRLCPKPKDTPELCCPHCQKYLGRGGNDGAGSLVVATGKCPYCLKQAFKPDSDSPIFTKPLLTLAQLRTAAGYQRSTGIYAIGSIAIFLAGSVLTALIHGYLVVPFFPVANSLGRLLSANVLVVLVAGMFVLLWLLWRGTVCCPSCGSAILRPGVTIASGRCQNCGVHVVSDASPLLEYRPLPKLREVQAAARACQTRRHVRLIGILFLACAICVAMVLFAEKALPPWQLDLRTNVLRVSTYAIGVPLVFGISFFPLLRQKPRRFPDLLCRNCGESIDHFSALLACTGNCPHCGQRAVKDA